MKILPGIDVLLRRYKRLLRGRRIGVIANATSVSSDLRSTVDVLAAQADLQLRALFGPEHGVRGDVQDAITVASSVDEATSLPVYSLYGPDKKPTTEMLAGIDLLIYDIQDVGCRYYTYPYTLSHAMEAAAEHDASKLWFWIVPTRSMGAPSKGLCWKPVSAHSSVASRFPCGMG